MEQLSNKRAQTGANVRSMPEKLQAARKLASGKAVLSAGYGMKAASEVVKPARHQDGFLARLGLSSFWRRADTAPSDLAEPQGDAELSVEAASGRDIRNWVLQWARLTENGHFVKSEVKFPATPDEQILEKKVSDGMSLHPIGLVTLVIEDVTTSDVIDLSGINAPHISIHIKNVVADHIDCNDSRFRKVFYLFDGKKEDVHIALTCRNADVDHLLIRSDSEEPIKAIHVDAHGVRCETLEVFNVMFLGGYYLDLLKAETHSAETHPYNNLFEYFSRSLDLSNATLSKAVLYRCAFTSIVSFRDARVRDLLKLEACHFIGFKLPKRINNDQSPEDQYDYDDILAGTSSLAGLTLDLSRADMGALCIRAIDTDPAGSQKNDRVGKKFPGQDQAIRSRGWMNFANAKARVLDMDFAYWDPSTDTSGRRHSTTLHHRLSGFVYGSLHIMPVGVELKEEKKEKKNANAPSKKTMGRETIKKLDDKSFSSRKPEVWKTVRSWLQAQLNGDLTKNFQAQPWTIAAKTFHAAGDFRQANELLMMRDRLAHASLWHKGNIGRWALELPNRIHGFGNRLWLPFVLMLALWVCGALFYQHSFNSGYFLPNPASGGMDQMSVGDDKSKLRKYPDATYPKFNAWIYSLDVMIPVVHFSQETYWVPGYGTRDAEQRDNVAAPEENRSLLERVTSGREGDGDGLLRLWIFYWAQIIFGYMGTVVIGLGLVGYLERRPPA